MNLQEQIKKYELMIELELRQSKEDYLKELEKVRQELHIKRMMVARLEKEVTEQQKCFVGILRGLRVDFRNLMQKFATEESKSLWKQISTMFDTVYTSCASGNLTSLQTSLPAQYIGLTSDIISSPLVLRKKGLDATSSSCISLESLGNGSNGDDENDRDNVGIEENSDGASNSSLPTLATSAKITNLTGNTTSFIVEAKERLQAHNQHMSQIFPTKTSSEIELTATPPIPKHLTNRQGNNSMGGKKDSYQNGALVSPVVRSRATKAAWKLPKTDRLSSVMSSPRSSSHNSPGSLRHQNEATMLTKTSPDSSRLSNRTPRSSMSQISLMYQETANEKAVTQQSQRKPKEIGCASLPLPRKGKAKTQSPSTTTSAAKQLSDKANPCLVDKENGILKIKDVLMHFPHLTEEQVRSHFENFMKYDMNNDYTLDFNELRTAVTQVLGHGVVSKQELLDVLEETNADYSNSIEFYEYLLLSKKCLDLTGTSDLFHNQLLVQQHKKFAEMCSIQ